MSGCAPFEIVDFSDLPGTPCPCGTARRAFTGTADFPATIHVTDISIDARLHYHQRISEMYFFLECESDACMQLGDEIVPVRPGLAILIRPGTRHRAIGRMKVLIVAIPKFDSADEHEV
jgi:mannose-6-phosphate isomerase-like protein (cupin superfamily)